MQKSQELPEEDVLHLTSLKEILGGFAHEIAQPLNAIMIASQVLRLKVERSDLPAEEETFLCQRLDLVSSQVRRASDIVDALRAFGGEDSYGGSGSDLKLAFEKIHALMAQQFVARGIDFRWEAPETLPQTSMNRNLVEGVLAQAMAYSRDTSQTIGEWHENRAAGHSRLVKVNLEECDGCARVCFSWGLGDFPKGAFSVDPETRLGMLAAKRLVSDCNGAFSLNEAFLQITFPSSG
jgi:nitrogen fixation/metabolism regulation signal transduction histidine kinase